MYVYWELESNLNNVPVGLEVVAATCGSLLFWHGNGISIWWLVSTKYNNQEIRIQLVGWHYILRWDHAFSYASVAIGSLVDLEQDLHWYIQYNLLQVECEALECLWIWWILKCDFNTGPCTKRCSKKFLKFKELLARVIACWGFCEDFDVCVAILPCDCWATLYGCYTSICWFIGYSFVEL